MTTTYLPKTAEIKRQWHELDATKFTLGRLATQAAKFLAGKHKATFTPHMDMGDFVVVINAEKVKTTGRKMSQKIYYRHSGYLGGLKKRTMKEELAKHPQKIVWRAVRGMLATNRLRRNRLARLKVVIGDKHTFKIDSK